MLFFFKKNKIHLDCFTSEDHVYEFFKIEHANKFYPDWWKKLPKEIVKEDISNGLAPVSTMKRCQGMIDHYTSGFIMPFWTDAIVFMEPQGSGKFGWQSAHDSTDVVVHPIEQRGDYLPESKYLHIKIFSPWYFSSNSDIKWGWNQPSWNFKELDQYWVLPGVLDYKYQHTTHINLALARDPRERKRIFINAGQPLVHLLPMTEKEVVVHNHLVSKDEMAKLKNVNVNRFKFNNLYKEGKKFTTKCPINH
jgi:hypothetical protein